MRRLYRYRLLKGKVLPTPKFPKLVAELLVLYVYGGN